MTLAWGQSNDPFYKHTPLFMRASYLSKVTLQPAGPGTLTYVILECYKPRNGQASQVFISVTDVLEELD